MFLTGFDSKTLNTLYVDKNLKYHGLIQAYSRTNRIINELKSQGNIVCFRNLKNATDEAITLFSNKDAIDVVIMEPYEDYIQKFDDAYTELLTIAPTVDSVNDLVTEDDELEFIKAFRLIMRIKNILSAFSNFEWDNLQMDEQAFEDYKSKYLDLWQKVKSNNTKEKVSILNDVDFELSLIHRDEINVKYIIQLLIKLKREVNKDVSKTEKEIFGLLDSDVNLRSKRELIERFIQENLPTIEDSDEISDEFDMFWSKERILALEKLSKEEGLDAEKLEKVIGNYMFTEKKPMRDDVIAMMNKRPSLKERKTVAERVTDKILGFVETFISGISKP